MKIIELKLCWVWGQGGRGCQAGRVRMDSQILAHSEQLQLKTLFHSKNRSVRKVRDGEENVQEGYIGVQEGYIGVQEGYIAVQEGYMEKKVE